MASPMLLVFGGIFALAGFGMAAVGGSGFRKWWTMRRMEPSKVAVEPGLREFEGRARATDEPVTAPFSGSQSVICEYEVERYSHSDQGSNWTTVTSGTETVPFEIEHSGSTVVVDPDNANRLLTEEFHVDTRNTDELPPRVQEHADENLSTGSRIEIGSIQIGGRRYRFRESRLDDGEEVYVLGPVEQTSQSVPEGSDARLAIAPEKRGWQQRLTGDPFVVSDTGEKGATRRQLKRAVVLSLVGLLFAVVGIGAILLA